MTVKILLQASGLITQIDEEDHKKVQGITWAASYDPGAKTHYVVGRMVQNGKRVSVKMHRLIMDCPKGSVIDHINRNGLDNRKENLRIVSVQENGQNRRLNANSTSKITGVTYREKWKNWEANIKVKGKTYYLGKFQTKEEAIAARKTAEKEFSFHPNHGTV